MKADTLESMVDRMQEEDTGEAVLLVVTRSINETHTVQDDLYKLVGRPGLWRIVGWNSDGVALRRLFADEREHRWTWDAWTLLVTKGLVRQVG